MKRNLSLGYLIAVTIALILLTGGCVHINADEDTAPPLVMGSNGVEYRGIHVGLDADSLHAIVEELPRSQRRSLETHQRGESMYEIVWVDRPASAIVGVSVKDNFISKFDVTTSYQDATFTLADIFERFGMPTGHTTTHLAGIHDPYLYTSDIYYPKHGINVNLWKDFVTGLPADRCNIPFDQTFPIKHVYVVEPMDDMQAFVDSFIQPVRVRGQWVDWSAQLPSTLTVLDCE